MTLNLSSDLKIFHFFVTLTLIPHREGKGMKSKRELYPTFTGSAHINRNCNLIKYFVIIRKEPSASSLIVLHYATPSLQLANVVNRKYCNPNKHNKWRTGPQDFLAVLRTFQAHSSLVYSHG